VREETRKKEGCGKACGLKVNKILVCRNIIPLLWGKYGIVRDFQGLERLSKMRKLGRTNYQ
jgi:hypothetical protein